jgi:hypothetical protein
MMAMHEATILDAPLIISSPVVAPVLTTTPVEVELESNELEDELTAVEVLDANVEVAPRVVDEELIVVELLDVVEVEARVVEEEEVEVRVVEEVVVETNPFVMSQ